MTRGRSPWPRARPSPLARAAATSTTSGARRRKRRSAGVRRSDERSDAMGTDGHPAVGVGVDRYALDLHEIDRTQVAVVGGKGAHLGELSRIAGIRVPPGFCVTTDAYRRVVEGAPAIEDRLERLSELKADDRDAIRALSAELRATIEAIPIPDDVTAAITRALARTGEPGAYAVR